MSIYKWRKRGNINNVWNNISRWNVSTPCFGIPSKKSHDKGSSYGGLRSCQPKWLDEIEYFSRCFKSFLIATHPMKILPYLYMTTMSHISVAVVERAREPGVHILTLPSHCSNKSTFRYFCFLAF